ncbi:hypothetical protein CMV_021619 [Castanea mollissima]|uniref:Uncharacterized protein n=1 Tax=Castanea mollissima TaxID=60419 RepID=A0A8J4QXT9_9ROSI|nr:hypothetical protein CMV_021619 [Castanea mollissima]
MIIIEGNVETSSNSGDGWGNQGAFCNMLYYDSLASLKRLTKLELWLEKAKAGSQQQSVLQSDTMIFR